MADVLITPASGIIEFKDGSSNVDGVIELLGTGDLQISAPGGDVIIGDTVSDLYIGDGTNNVDIVFEQDGEIRGLTGKTISLGQVDSYIKIVGGLKDFNNQIGSSGQILKSTGAGVTWSNVGSGSGLDADTLDGLDSTQFLRSDANDSFTGTITNSGTFVSYFNANTPGSNLRLGRDSSQYYTFHGGSGGNYLTSISSSGNPKALLKFAYSVDGGTTIANEYILNGSSGTIWHSGNDGAGSGLDADFLDGQQGSYYLNTSTAFGGDVSGTYNAIVVANDSHTHAFNNLTGKTSGTGNYTTTGNFTSAALIPTGATVPTNGMYLPAANNVAMSTGSSERLRIDSSGRLLVGTSTKLGSTEKKLEVANSILGNSNFANNAFASAVLFEKGRGTSVGTIVQNNDELGSLIFRGDDGVDSFTTAAQIVAYVDGTPGANDMPGRLVFSTTADGAASPTERLRISSTGTVSVAGAIELNGTLLDINNSAGTSGQLLSSTGTGVDWIDSSSISVGDASTLDGLDSTQFLRSDVADTAAGAITFNGGLTIGTSQIINHNGIGSKDKIRVWNSSAYSIGMTNGLTFGAIDNDYAMTFGMSNTNTRGWLWYDSAHTAAQGAMSLSTQGKLSVAHSIRLGYGESDTTVPGATYRLDVSGSTLLNGSVELEGTLVDINGAAGTAGQILSSTGTGVDWIDASTITAGDANTLDGLDSTQFIRSDVDDSFSGVVTGSSMLKMTNAVATSTSNAAIWLSGTSGALLLDSAGQKRLSWNDGGGNLNIRAGAYFNGGDKYVVTNDGACDIECNSDAGNGAISFRVATQGTAGNTISWAKQVVLTTTVFTCDGNEIWHAGNDGAGSGLDADLLDGQQGSYYLNTSATAQTKAGDLTLSSAAPSFILTETDTTTQSRLVLSSGDLYIQSGAAGSGGSGSGDIRVSGYNGVDIANFQVRKNSAYYDVLDGSANAQTKIGNLTVSADFSASAYKGNPYDAVPAYNNSDYETIYWDTAESAIRLQSSTDSTIGMAFPAFRVNVNTGDTFRIAIQIRASAVTANGVYIRVYEYDGSLPAGKTHVSNDAVNAVVQEDTRLSSISPTYENQPGDTSWQTIEFTYTPAGTATWASVVVLNWSGLGTNALYVRDYKRELILSGSSVGDADTLDGLDSTQFLRSDAADTHSGGVLTFSTGIHITNGPGTIAGATFNNGWLRIGTSSLGWTFDNNEFYTAGACVIGSLAGSTLTFQNIPAFNGGTSGSTSPFTVDSTTVVANLNADLLDGQQGSYYLNTSTTFGGDVSGTYNAIVVANDSHTHAFNNLTDKTSGTGEYSTSSNLVSGRGSGGVALTINDGYGNANVTFNHKGGTPEQDGKAGRIEVNTDSTTGDAVMSFELGDAVNGVTAAITQILALSRGTSTWSSSAGLTFNNIPAFNGGTSGSTAPFTVDSNTVVTNLNADLLDGQEGSYYLNTSTTFGGDVSGTYNAIVVANDSHTHAFNNLTGKTSGTGNYTTTGTFTGNTLASTVATGTAPLTVTSTTVVTNLNADLLDGVEGGNYLRSNVNDSFTGSILTIAGANYTSYNSTKGLNTLINGSTFGGLIESAANGHMVIGIRANDVSDSFAVASDSTNDGTYDKVLFRVRDNGTIETQGNTIWHAGNDGAGSGLDADLLDGLNAASTNTASTIVARDGSGNFSAGTITATTLVKSGGTSSQFLKADGSVDSNSYITSASIGDGILTLNTSGTGLSGNASFTANQSGNTTFTVTSNATSTNTGNTIVARDGSGNFYCGTVISDAIKFKYSGVDYGTYINANNTNSIALYGANTAICKFNLNSTNVTGGRRILADGPFAIETSNNQLHLSTNGGTLALEAGSNYVTSGSTYNKTTGAAANMRINASGQFLTSTSSLRYKTNIEDVNIGYSENIIYNSRPVWYRSTSESDNLDWSWWGFIAEELDLIDKRLVDYDSENKPNGVQYDRFTVHLVKIAQEQKKTIDENQRKINELELEIENIKKIISNLI